MRTPGSGSEDWKSQVVAPMLNCDGGGFDRVIDGASNTIMWIEDAGRSHPDVENYGAYSDTVHAGLGRRRSHQYVQRAQRPARVRLGRRRCRRQWLFRPQQCRQPRLAEGSTQQLLVARWRTRRVPLVGQQLRPERRAILVPLGGLNATMGDGSVHFLADSMDGVVVKWLVGAERWSNRRP